MPKNHEKVENVHNKKYSYYQENPSVNNPWFCINCFPHAYNNQLQKQKIDNMRKDHESLATLSEFQDLQKKLRAVLGNLEKYLLLNLN